MALYHWQRVRALARQAGGGAEAAGLTIVAVTMPLASEWRMGAAEEQWEELFKEGCAAAEGAGDLSALALLNMSYGAMRLTHKAIYDSSFKLAAEIADRTGDIALRCLTRSSLSLSLTVYGPLREAERVAEEAIELAHGDPHLGADLAGISPLLGAQFVRLRCIGYTRDPAKFLQEFPQVRQFALDSGYPDMAALLSSDAALLKWDLASCDGIRALAQAAVRLTENLGVGNRIVAARGLCAAFACEHQWQPVLDTAGDTLRLIRERGAMRTNEPDFLAFVATAQLELGNPVAARLAAQEAVAFMCESKVTYYPRCYAVLARAQLALGEPVADITSTLEEYAALLERTEAHLFEGEVHELRARLADREGRPAEKIAFLQRAFDCYTRIGMSAHAARVKELLGYELPIVRC